MTCGRFHVVGIMGTLLAVLLSPPSVAQTSEAQKLLAEADRLAWLRVWTRAEPLYASARDRFIANGDERNALYAEVSRLPEKPTAVSVGVTASAAPSTDAYTHRMRFP